jgi:hypothetical protein
MLYVSVIECLKCRKVEFRRLSMNNPFEITVFGNMTSSDIFEEYFALVFGIEDESNMSLQNFGKYLPDTTWHHIPENSNPHSHNCENLIAFHTVYYHRNVNRITSARHS